MKENKINKKEENQEEINIDKGIEINQALEIMSMIKKNKSLEEISKDTGRTIKEIERVKEILTS